MYRRKRWLQEQNKTKYEKTEDFPLQLTIACRGKIFRFFRFSNANFPMPTLTNAVVVLKFLQTMSTQEKEGQSVRRNENGCTVQSQRD